MLRTLDLLPAYDSYHLTSMSINCQLHHRMIETPRTYYLDIELKLCQQVVVLRSILTCHFSDVTTMFGVELPISH